MTASPSCSPCPGPRPLAWTRRDPAPVGQEAAPRHSARPSRAWMCPRAERQRGPAPPFVQAPPPRTTQRRASRPQSGRTSASAGSTLARGTTAIPHSSRLCSSPEQIGLMARLGAYFSPCARARWTRPLRRKRSRSRTAWCTRRASILAYSWTRTFRRRIHLRRDKARGRSRTPRSARMSIAAGADTGRPHPREAMRSSPRSTIDWTAIWTFRSTTSRARASD